jgi:hypothetical protein
MGRTGATPDTDYLQATVTDPVSPYELKAADIIKVRLISGVTSDSELSQPSVTRTSPLRSRSLLSYLALDIPRL